MCSSITGIVVLGLCLLLAMPTLFFFYRHVCCRRQTDSKPKASSKKGDPESRICVLSMIVCSMFFIGVFSTFLAGIFHCIVSDLKITSFWEQLGTFSYLLGQFTLQFVYILRIKHCFNGPLSVFAVSQTKIRVIYVGLGASIFFVLILIIISRAVWTDYSYIVIASILLFIICYFGTYGYIMRLFWVKNCEMLEYKSNSDNMVKLSPSSGGASEGNKENEFIIVEIKRMSVLIRYTVSVSVGFTTTLMLFVFLLIWAIFIIRERANDNDIGLQVRDILLAMDSMVNFMCVSMLFEFDFINKFYVIGCKICSNLVRNRLANRVKINVDELYA